MPEKPGFSEEAGFLSTIPIELDDSFPARENLPYR